MNQTSNFQDTASNVKIAVIGNVDSGKSTLVGVLTKGDKDDGRGSARLKVMNYKHEQMSGRTSSMATEIMGFRDNGEQVLPDRFQPCKNKFWKEVVEGSTKIVSFVDLCGHEKYLKTTIHGLVSMLPDYSMIIVGSNMGVSKMTREHLGISLFLQIPFLIVITKIDMAPPEVHNQTLENIKSIVKSPMVKRTAVVFDENSKFDEIDKWAKVIHGNAVTPIFNVSSVTGAGLIQLRRFIYMLNNRNKINKAFGKQEDPFQFDIQEIFNVQGVGRIVSGIVRSGTAKVGQIVLLGPNKSKQFRQVAIKSIQMYRVNTNEATIGQYVTFALKPLKAGDKLERKDFRKGMVLLDSVAKPEPVREFEANIHVLHHPTTMSCGYQGVLHTGVVRQTVEIKKMHTKEVIRTGDVELIRFKLLFYSEFLTPNQILVIREGRTKIFGFITSVITDKQLQLEGTIIQ